LDSYFLLDYIEDIVMVIDHGYRIRYVNKAIKNLVGKSPESITGKKCYSLLFGFTEPCRNCQIQNLKNNKLAINILHDAITHKDTEGSIHPDLRHLKMVILLRSLQTLLRIKS